MIIVCADSPGAYRLLRSWINPGVTNRDIPEDMRPVKLGKSGRVALFTESAYHLYLVDRLKGFYMDDVRVFRAEELSMADIIDMRNASLMEARKLRTASKASGGP